MEIMFRNSFVMRLNTMKQKAICNTEYAKDACQNLFDGINN